MSNNAVKEFCSECKRTAEVGTSRGHSIACSIGNRIAMPRDRREPLTVESMIAQLQETFPRWKYFVITVSVGAPRKRYWLKLGPSFYSADVLNVWGDTLDEVNERACKYAAASAK